MRGRFRKAHVLAATLALTAFAGIPGWSSQALASPAATGHNGSAAGARPLAISPAALPRAVGAVSYNKWLSASGGAGAPYSFSLDPSSKRLPPGLTLTSTGHVTGTPTQVGNFPITVQVTDKAGNVRSTTYTMTVKPGISLTISGYVGNRCHVAGPFASGSMTVAPFAFGPVKSVKGAVQVPGSNGPSLVTFSLNGLGSSGKLGLGWLTVINTTDAQCSALNPVFSLGRPTRMGPAAASGTGWFIATVNGVNYTLAVQYKLVTQF